MTRSKSSDIRGFLLDQVARHPHDVLTLAAEHFNLTRQAVSRHLRQLVAEGVLEVTGATRNRQWRLRELEDYTKVIDLRTKPAEDQIWRTEIRPRLQGIPENVLAICAHGFSEIFNNAVAHSEGTECSVVVKRTGATVKLAVNDNGIGIFKKIQQALHLDDPRHAALELAKGKLTTDPSGHTGEGIFFTSRMFDQFSIGSHEFLFNHIQPNDDWLTTHQDHFEGTLVLMQISLSSDRTVRQTFDRFASGEDNDYAFSRTHVPLSLAAYGDEQLVSRSQARRVLSRFERFKIVCLDFRGIDSIGQAFADEIFRVYRREHPETAIECFAANEQVGRMISRALHTSTEDDSQQSLFEGSSEN